MDSLRFLCDGQRVSPENTPDDLDLEDGDVIEAHREQVSDFLVQLNGTTNILDWRKSLNAIKMVTWILVFIGYIYKDCSSKQCRP